VHVHSDVFHFINGHLFSINIKVANKPHPINAVAFLEKLPNFQLSGRFLFIPPIIMCL